MSLFFGQFPKLPKIVSPLVVQPMQHNGVFALLDLKCKNIHNKIADEHFPLVRRDSKHEGALLLLAVVHECTHRHLERYPIHSQYHCNILQSLQLQMLHFLAPEHIGVELAGRFVIGEVLLHEDGGEFLQGGGRQQQLVSFY